MALQRFVQMLGGRATAAIETPTIAVTQSYKLFPVASPRFRAGAARPHDVPGGCSIKSNGCSFQFGRTSTRLPPEPIHIPSDGRALVIAGAAAKGSHSSAEASLAEDAESEEWQTRYPLDPNV